MGNRWCALLLAIPTLWSCAKKTDSRGGPAEDAAPVAAETAAAPTDAKPGWVPNEFKSGAERWRDATVYVDGVPRGVIWFGDLPPSLQPTWVEQEEEIDFKPGDTVRTRTVRERRYLIASYLEAVGVDLKKVKEVHIYGGAKQYAMRLTGPDLRKVRDCLYFRFGRQTSGKTLLGIDMKCNYKPNSDFDHLAGIAVYVKKEPPQVNEHNEVVFKGEVYRDVPYYGTPLRGGIRIYHNDRLVTLIKRRLLEEREKLATMENGELRWKLAPFLAAQGVDIKKAVVAEVIYDERRGHRFEKEALESLYFVANPQKSGEILLGDSRIPAHALALYDSPQPAREPVPASDN